MRDQSNNPSHHEWMLYHRATSRSLQGDVLEGGGGSWGGSTPEAMNLVVGHRSNQNPSLNTSLSLSYTKIHIFIIADVVLLGSLKRKS